MSKPVTPFDELEQRIGHQFNQPELLRSALTHASATTGRNEADNERLEFLGDRVLALLAAECLLQHFPDTDEGGLAVRLNALVRRETCADVGKRLDLGRHLILAEAESRSGGRNKPAILADACEAIMGALYLDGGLAAARNYFSAYWGDLLTAMGEPPRDAKTALQEWSQGLGLPPPSYRVVARSGPDHEPSFSIEVAVADRPPCHGRGATKKAAEHEAAATMLVREGVWRGASEP